MITLTRRQARCLRGVFRRRALGIARRGPIPPLVLEADGSRLRARYRDAGLAVEHVAANRGGPPAAAALPLDALADFDGSDESPVALEAVAVDKTVARWSDGGIPQVREYAVSPLDTLAPFPERASARAPNPALLWDALREAVETSVEDTSRYALNCLQLKGERGELVATDGRQLLVQGGFRFPWEGDLLVRRSPVFACRELRRDRELSVGRTDSNVVVASGPWTVFLPIRADDRFPDVARAIPDAASPATRLRLAPEDAAFLIRALDRLPDGEAANAPATLDLNGRIAVRVRGSAPSSATELILARSDYAGIPARVHTNRSFLARAVGLGFAEIAIVDADSPLVCRDARRIFVWQPLNKDSAVAAADDVVRIVSATPISPTSFRSTGTEKTSPTVSERPTTSADPGAENGSAAPESTGAVGLAALIQETESLHETLGDARGRTGRLLVALRRYRRRERLVSSTLASLNELKLSESAG